MIATAIEKKDLIGLVSGAPKVISTDAQHERYVSTLLELDRLDQRGRLDSAGRELAELLTVLIDKYEREHHSIHGASAVEVLRELMEANDLRQRDLVPELGTESVVSAVLNGKRELNKDHIARLSKRFHVSPAVFFRDEDAAPARRRIGRAARRR
ncbi:MAG TPA: helix-turn-helix domain-containing protein [Candidatus Acidoferrales bacterium]|jgi:HTH-type transcriptional regulator/antitoxin HigA|nr:helix-turn-helix domain-containing protein [Candidatus Acidoferrales bacterium]